MRPIAASVDRSKMLTSQTPTARLSTCERGLTVSSVSLGSVVMALHRETSRRSLQIVEVDTNRQEINHWTDLREAKTHGSETFSKIKEVCAKKKKVPVSQKQRTHDAFSKSLQMCSWMKSTGVSGVFVLFEHALRDCMFTTAAEISSSSFEIGFTSVIIF